jgi:hypothetical protein
MEKIMEKTAEKNIMVSRGSGMTEGLELWYSLSVEKYILVDKSKEQRFAADIELWNSAVGLNKSNTKKSRDKEQNAAK